MASHSAEPQVLFMTPSCLQSQYHLGDSYTLPSSATAQGTTLAISGTQPLCSQKTLARRFCLNDAGLFLITVNFLAPANQHRESQAGLKLMILLPLQTLANPTVVHHHNPITHDMHSLISGY